MGVCASFGKCCLRRWHAEAKEDSMKTTLCLAVALVALSPPARAGSQGAVSGTATSPDRIPIRYHAAGKGDPALVFVHCGGCERSFWDGQVAHFAAKHRVVALDLAGHGQSGAGRKDWTMPAFGQDVVSVVDALGLKRVVLIGHSLGGPVVLEAARRMPGRVAGLVLVDTLVDFEQRLAAEEMEKFLSALQADRNFSISSAASLCSKSTSVSTNTRPATRPGIRRAASRTTGPPREWPMSTTRFKPSASTTDTTSSPKAGIVQSLRPAPLWPWPARSSATTRCFAAKWATCPSQKLRSQPPQWTNTRAGSP